MEDSSGPNLWETLPEECKSMILSRLSNKEAARIARVSKEFDEGVKSIRDAVQLLVLPPDLSPAALEGFVASHRNLKSISFKRCSGKVKSFLPILEAAAGGKLDSKWYHRRSLEFVDFRSCGFLTDVDVNALCVLHSRLEDVHLANCHGISDVALTVLSRYQQSRPAPRDSTPEDSAAPSTTLLEETEESPEFVYQGPGIVRAGSDNFWPELNPHAQSMVNNKSESKGFTYGAQKTNDNQSLGLPHTLYDASDRTFVDVGQDLKTGKQTSASRSYAQAASKVLTGDKIPFLVQSNSPGSSFDTSNKPTRADKKNTLGTNTELVTLSYIDWTTVKIPLGTAPEAFPGARSIVNHSNGPCILTAAERLALEDSKQGIFESTFSQTDKGYKALLLDIKESPDAKEMDALQLDSTIKDLQKEDVKPPTSRRMEKVLVEGDGKGISYYSLDFESSGDRRLATRRSLHIPDCRASTSEVEYNKLLQDFNASKAVRAGGAKQVTNHRLELSSKESSKNRIEAFRTTESTVGLFMISRDNSDAITNCSNVDDTLQHNLLDAYKRNGKGSSSLEAFSPLPVGLKGLQVGAMMKRGKHKDIAPELLDYQMETPVFFCKGDEEPWKARGLRSVSVAGCSDITDKGVQALLRGPSKESLVSLDISRCSGVTSAGLRLPSVSALEVLAAAQLPNITRLLLQLSIEGSLRHLSLAACPKLDDLHLVAPYLQTLNVSNCKKLVRLQLKCPELLSFNLSLCDSLENIARFTCGLLQNVNAYGCRLLTPSAFSSIVDSAVDLRELRCGGCDRLERLEISQMSLLRLEAPGCSSLRRLNLQSRSLKVIDTCGCKNLVEVYLYSPNLRRMLFSNCALLQTLVLPLDAMKQSVDIAIKRLEQDPNALQEGFEISISGCNVSESVQKNLARLSKQWKATFAH